MGDEWSFEENMDRGALPTGEPLECLYGAGWWSAEPAPAPPIVQCYQCGGHAYDLGHDRIDCENCGVILTEPGIGRYNMQVHLGKHLGIDVTVQLQRVGGELYLLVLKPSGQQRIKLSRQDILDHEKISVITLPKTQGGLRGS